ncbi:malonyl-CoA decarboxylase, mitochondrial isoform X2 [Ixodes scapularis]|uniref:malonyl-CoA decarboxylase, mitochondrial isoform X1 n=2 Tax=Ixodes scapularis TaxID=6945 RepID=UPI001A9D1154|nr:malonyl-CoA decarboxylase, mitochondrial isoform X1 [Ixodes scapularis]XP_040064750.1 malonyl-CoA decarboxylase, mitochondrial isoform X2 [Ixodes scapularis]
MFSYFFRRNVFKYVPGARMTSNIKIDMKTVDLKALTGSIIEYKETSHGESKLKTFCSIYKQGTKGERYAFLQHLAKEFYINRDRFESAVRHYLDTRVEESAFRLRDEERLSTLLTPKYLSFFHILGRSEGGVKFLVDMREDLLDLISSSQLESPSSYDVRHMNTILKELLSLWFTVGFMKLERITWQSSCEMLQKISDYEAVHPVRNWTDLKRRVGPYRRCYVITHSCMPGEPIVVLHTALTNSISASIQRIIVGYKPDRAESQASDEWEDDKVIKAAIFYSISSTQKGLQGIELGKYLIKGVVKEVKAEFPHIQDFSSLSPIPGFKNWLVSEVHKVIKGQPESRKLLNQRELEEIVAPYREDREPLEAFLRLLRNNGWYQVPELVQRLEAPLMRLCAFYLYHEKRRGYALNGVANFHLKNGAVIWRLNWLGDISPRGLSASCSIMVNYRYYLDEMETNRQKYLEHFTVPASDIFLEHLKPLQSSL